MGGAERSLLDLMASVIEACPDWPLNLIVSGPGPLVAKAVGLGVPTTVVPFPRALAELGDTALSENRSSLSAALSMGRRLAFLAPSLVHYVRTLRRAIRNLAPDLIHTNGLKMHVLGLWAKPRKTPLLWHIHDYLSLRPVMSPLLRAHSSSCAAALANSRSVAADLQNTCGKRLKIFPLYNAVDLKGFSPCGVSSDLDALAQLESAEPGTIRVGLLGTTATWKGHEVFLRALSMLPSDLPVRGYFIGDAVYETRNSQYRLDDLRQIASQLGLADRVGFTGFVDDPARALRALDIVVHASTRPEPFGLVIAEAMACGRSVIVSRAGGAAEIAGLDKTAMYHDPGDARMLADQIKRLATDERLRRSCGQSGRQTAERWFDRARLAAELVPIYRATVSMN
jgi:glycosyltransferase involved in cell wall biosynthesis